MVFGRKKKQEELTLNQDKDLEPGNEDELNDDLSTTDSVPPPPPTGIVTATKNEKISQNDSRTLEESPSVGANADADDSSMDKEKEAKLIKRNKLLLIGACVISFFIFLAMAIAYGTSRNQSDGSDVSVTSGIEEASLSPITNIIEVPTMISEIEVIQDVDSATDIAVIMDVDQQTAAPTIEIDGCVLNEISVVTTCQNNGAASAIMSFCLVDEVSDQFWAWVSTPPRTAQIVANDWGWIRDGTEKELASIPVGRYEIGLFSNGEEILNQYPVLTSIEFTVNCE